MYDQILCNWPQVYSASTSHSNDGTAFASEGCFWFVLPTFYWSLLVASSPAVEFELAFISLGFAFDPNDLRQLPLFVFPDVKERILAHDELN